MASATVSRIARRGYISPRHRRLHHQKSRWCSDELLFPIPGHSTPASCPNSHAAQRCKSGQGYQACHGALLQHGDWQNVSREFRNSCDSGCKVSAGVSHLLLLRDGSFPEFKREFSSSRGCDGAEEMQDREDYLVGGRYCILLTDHGSDYSRNRYGGYGEMFKKLLGDPSDTWDVYPVVEGQFPSDEELEKYDGFVVTGSRHDAHGDEEWILRLCSLLRSLHQKERKTLGICFGHQVLSRALGGTTGKADVGWELGLRGIQITRALTTKPYASGVPPVLRILESHQDQVLELPPGGEVLGFSERTSIELFGVGDHALGIQGHPEFTEDVLRNILDTRFTAGVFKEEEVQAAKATLKAAQADEKALVRLCKGFLKRKT